MGRPLVASVTGQRKQRMINDGIIDLGSTWSSDKVSGLISGWNLLDNWYLVDPVNQRGLSSYPATPTTRYTIDRWRAPQAMEVSLSDGGLLLANTYSDYNSLVQVIEFPDGLWGRTFTMSVLKNGGLLTHTFTLPNTPPDTHFSWSDPLHGDVNGRPSLFWHNSFSQLWFTMRLFPESALHVQAVKLELGTVSTLANDPPPDFGMELLKCQRYQLVFMNPGTSGSIAGGQINPHSMTFSVPVPVQMRILPVISGSLGVMAGEVMITNWDLPVIVAPPNRPNIVHVQVNQQGHGMPTGNGRLMAAAGAMFDANL